MSKNDHPSRRSSLIDDLIDAVAALSELRASGTKLKETAALVDRLKTHVRGLGVQPGDPRLEAW